MLYGGHPEFVVTPVVSLQPWIESWKAEQIALWFRGLEDQVCAYGPKFQEAEITGGQLLMLSGSDIERIGVTSPDHKSKILQAIAGLIHSSYNVEWENLQSLALALRLKCTSLNSELRRVSHCASVDESVHYQTLIGVSALTYEARRILFWLDRSPFSNLPQYIELKQSILTLAMDIVKETKNYTRTFPEVAVEIQMACASIVAVCDRIIQDMNEPLVVQTAHFDRVLLRRQSVKDELGFHLKSSFNGVLLISSIKPGSAADRCGKIEAGDEIVQINDQIVIGWHVRKVALILKEFKARDIIFLLKKPPREHSSGYKSNPQTPRLAPAQTTTTPTSLTISSSGASLTPGSGKNSSLASEQHVSSATPPTQKKLRRRSSSMTIPRNQGDRQQPSNKCDTLSRRPEQSPSPDKKSVARKVSPEVETVVQRRASISGGSPTLKRLSVHLCRNTIVGPRTQTQWFSDENESSSSVLDESTKPLSEFLQQHQNRKILAGIQRNVAPTTSEDSTDKTTTDMATTTASDGGSCSDVVDSDPELNDDVFDIPAASDHPHYARVEVEPRKSVAEDDDWGNPIMIRTFSLLSEKPDASIKYSTVIPIESGSNTRSGSCSSDWSNPMPRTLSVLERNEERDAIDMLDDVIQTEDSKEMEFGDLVWIDQDLVLNVGDNVGERKILWMLGVAQGLEPLPSPVFKTVPKDRKFSQEVFPPGYNIDFTPTTPLGGNAVRSRVSQEKIRRFFGVNPSQALEDAHFRTLYPEERKDSSPFKKVTESVDLFEVPPSKKFSEIADSEAPVLKAVRRLDSAKLDTTSSLSFGAHNRLAMAITLPCKSLGRTDHCGWVHRARLPFEKVVLGTTKWIRRWAVLKDDVMYVYKSPEDAKAEGVIFLPKFTVCPAGPRYRTSRKNVFKVENAFISFYFYVDQHQEMIMWLNSLGLAAIQFKESEDAQGCALRQSYLFLDHSDLPYLQSSFQNSTDLYGTAPRAKSQSPSSLYQTTSKDSSPATISGGTPHKTRSRLIRQFSSGSASSDGKKSSKKCSTKHAWTLDRKASVRSQSYGGKAEGFDFAVVTEAMSASMEARGYGSQWFI